LLTKRMKKSFLRHKIIHFVDTYSISSLERKIESATEGLSSDCFNFVHNKVLSANKENALIICDYISSLKSEVNPSDHYRKNTLILLCTFSIFFKNAKPFKEIVREDIL